MSTQHSREPIRLYGMALSGHCHRVELFLALLDLPCTYVPVDLAAGDHKRPEFLALNPFGQVPVIQDGALTLGDSNAILVYLEARYAPGQWLPRDPWAAARVQRWLSVAAGPLAFGPAAARVITLFRRADDPAPAIARAHQLLRVMEQQLAAEPWLAGNGPTLADIANYGYTARAPEGNVALDEYPAVRAWLRRVEGLPRFVPIASSPVGLCA
jgi:glutathione S-transferase